MSNFKTQAPITRKFQVRYQLGGYGTEHRNIMAAINAANKAARSARRSGDLQGIHIEVNEYRNGRIYGQGDLTTREQELIDLYLNA